MQATTNYIYAMISTNVYVYVIAKKAKLVLYADDTSLIITSPNYTEFVTKLNNVLDVAHEWFKSNLLF